jgi:hypothetical protein
MSTLARPEGAYVVGIQDELMSLTIRLVEEYPEMPAGSVMRCVARAVRRAVVAGTPGSHVPAEAERRARHALAGRTMSQRDAFTYQSRRHRRPPPHREGTGEHHECA